MFLHRTVMGGEKTMALRRYEAETLTGPSRKVKPDLYLKTNVVRVKGSYALKNV